MSLCLLQKRQRLHSQIRHDHIQEYMKKIRYEMIKNQKSKSIDLLISSTQLSIQPNQFELLCFYANQDQDNAIIHFGNLLIDGVISPQILQHFQFNSINSQYWSWLCKVLVHLNHANFKLLSNCLNSLSVKSSVFTLKLILDSLKKLLQQEHPKCLQILFKSQNPIQCIKSHTLHIQRSISDLCYQIIDLIVSIGHFQTLKFTKIYGEENLRQVLLIGFSKYDIKQKKFPLIICRIINNLMQSGIHINLTKQCMQLTNKVKQHIKLQLSFLWATFVNKMHIKPIQDAVQLSLLSVLTDLMVSQYKSKQIKQTVRQNVMQTLNLLKYKSSAFSYRNCNNLIGNLKLLQLEYGLIFTQQTYTIEVSQTNQSMNYNIIQMQTNYKNTYIQSNYNKTQIQQKYNKKQIEQNYQLRVNNDMMDLQ